MRIAKTRWLEAQEAERKCHSMTLMKGLRYYQQVYSKYFSYLNINPNLKNKTIVEVGPADFPALYYCENYRGIIVEPMESEYLNLICQHKNIYRIAKPLEECALPKADEIWLLNVMQHVIDPELFVHKCKEAACTIRFFEPINYPVCVYHPHSFTIDDFKQFFNNVNLYTDRLPCFFDGDCAYGVWSLN